MKREGEEEQKLHIAKVNKLMYERQETINLISHPLDRKAEANKEGLR